MASPGFFGVCAESYSWQLLKPYSLAQSHYDLWMSVYVMPVLYKTTFHHPKKTMKEMLSGFQRDFCTPEFIALFFCRCFS
jgi:hypothetical protein